MKDEKPKKVKARCRHDRNSWIIAGGHYEWCYVCGALRVLRITGPNTSVADSKWAVPTKDTEDNPYDKWEKSLGHYQLTT